MSDQNIKWNNKVKLVLADVDETIADVYTPAEPEMIGELTSVLEEGVVIFFVTGASLARVESRITNQIPGHLRRFTLVSHCNGAEVWGFNSEGDKKEKPFYSLYDETFSQQQKDKWREIVKQLIEEFKLSVYPATKVSEFKTMAGHNPLAVMLEDRGPQITFEFVNGYDLTPEQEKQLEMSVPQTNGALDLRIPVLERADRLFQENNIPVTPRLGGIFALDFAIKGVSKTYSVKHVLENENILESAGLSRQDLENPDHIEIWGDKFDQFRGGTDRHMCEAVNPKVRAIDFREEDPSGFLPGYNVVIWKGKYHLHHGLLEYLKSRHNK
jgi:hydroxymethylpyrimidine pyrophosphatase-like HAD family hydrolase